MTENSLTENSLIEAAKRPIEAYGSKDWKALRQAVAPHILYDEVATQRHLEGVDEVMAVWKAWASALPDSEATVDSAHASGTTVVLELTWRGHHNGPLVTPDRTLAATGNSIELRACQVIDMDGGKPASVRHYFDMASLLQQIGAGAAKPQQVTPTLR
jgi:steroid delta-isomerase-like uncharacterized protein